SARRRWPGNSDGSRFATHCAPATKMRTGWRTPPSIARTDASSRGAVLSRDEIRANVAAVNARIEAACARAGRDRRDVTLVAVSKTFPAEAVSHAVAAGITDVGENRVQEAREKWEILCSAAAPGGEGLHRAAEGGGATWHLIGH